MPAKNKLRLDVYLTESGKSESREKAKREILAGWVRINGETVHDPSRPVAGDESITVERPRGIYVSRGGEKLAHALEVFPVSVRERVAADLGASTGGFTHCLLEAGAKKIYAVDVGYGQLDYRLRMDERVVVLERTHVNSLQRDQFEVMPDLVTVDLSFISLLRIIDHLILTFAPAEGIILIKPQFEAFPGEHKKGVVRHREVHRDILKRVLFALFERDLGFQGLTYSPIKGPKGNIEFFLFCTIGREEKSIRPVEELSALIEDVVLKAHEKLG